MIFLLTLLPFMFIKFFYGPWIEAEPTTALPASCRPGRGVTSSSRATIRLRPP